MATTSAPPLSGRRTVGGVDVRVRVPDWWDGFVGSVPAWVWTGGFLLLLTAVSVFIRTRQIGGQFWMDEAITVGISSHPLTQIPGVLRMDGSPPLFYLALHIWMSMFGDSEAATHALALLFATLCIPVAFWGAQSMFGRRTGLYAATLFAFNAFLTEYAQETRMYSLMGLLGLLATIGFLQGFVFRRRRYVALFAVAQALMLYTHAWGIFYGVGSFVALVVFWRVCDDDAVREHLVRDAVLAYVGAGVLFLPWLPNFVFQSIHTAAPWDTPPRFGAPIQLSRNVIGGDRVTAALATGSLIGLAPLFLRRGRSTPAGRAMWMLIGITVLTLGLAYVSSQITPAWVPRYFAPIVAPILLLAAMGMARAGFLGFVAILLSIVFLANTTSYTPRYKSDMRDVAAEMRGDLRPGDLVLVGQPEQTPLAYYYLPGGLRFANTAGGTVLRDPTFMNWIDALSRLKGTNPSVAAPRLLDSMKVGQQLLFIRPLTEGAQNWKAPWTRLVRRRSAQWGAIIASDKQFVQEAWAPHNYRGACCVADSAALYKKVS